MMKGLPFILVNCSRTSSFVDANLGWILSGIWIWFSVCIKCVQELARLPSATCLHRGTNVVSSSLFCRTLHSKGTFLTYTFLITSRYIKPRSDPCRPVKDSLVDPRRSNSILGGDAGPSYLLSTNKTDVLTCGQTRGRP